MYNNDLINITNALIDTWGSSPYHRSYGSKVSINRRNVTVKAFCDAIKNLGFTIGKPYHANGIGNNNEFSITKRIKLPDGYEADAIIGSFHYNYDLYCKHVFVSFRDKDGILIYKFPEHTVYYEDE